MWCDCLNISPSQLGCANFPYSNGGDSQFRISINIQGVGDIDWNDGIYTNAFFILKEMDDVKANIFGELSLENGLLEIDSNNSTRLIVNFSDKMLTYKGKVLYYQFFVTKDGVNIPYMKGQFIKEQYFK